MLLENLSIEKLPYLERYVNSGSPSGFTNRYTTSEETKPFGLSPFFHPLICVAPEECFKNYGKIPAFKEFEEVTGKNWLLVHPDMKKEKVFKAKNVSLTKSKKIKLVPTASGRTVELFNSSTKGYFKLHYTHVIGRITRELDNKIGVAGPEISKHLVSLIDQNKLDSRLTLMRETGARIFQGHVNEKPVEWGMVWREKDAYKIDYNEVKYVIPVFSLFGKDILAKRDKPLLQQIINHIGANPTDYVLKQLIFPMIELYFNLIKNSGIQPEWHAQNLLIGFTKDFAPVKFIMRDLESMDKDLTFMKEHNIKAEFESYPFKCIFREQWNYQRKHSFMYDYKFGEYIIRPLLDFLKKKYKVDTLPLHQKIKLHSKKFINEFPKDFFPEYWVVFRKILINQKTDKRPYIHRKNPKFRF